MLKGDSGGWYMLCKGDVSDRPVRRAMDTGDLEEKLRRFSRADVEGGGDGDDEDREAERCRILGERWWKCPW